MGEYTEIQGQIARIEDAYALLHGLKIGSTRAAVVIGRRVQSRSAPPHRPEWTIEWFANIDDGEVLEVRPTLAGALTALEMRIATAIDEKLSDLKALESLRASLKTPNFDQLAGHLGATEHEDL